MSSIAAEFWAFKDRELSGKKIRMAVDGGTMIAAGGYNKPQKLAEHWMMWMYMFDYLGKTGQGPRYYWMDLAVNVDRIYWLSRRFGLFRAAKTLRT